MTLQQQKKLYEQGNHICVAQFKGKKPFIDQKATFCNLDGISYTLVLKSHSHILDAYLDGCEIHDMSNKKGQSLEEDFISTYLEGDTYLAIPESLENCYCEATKLHYEKLKDLKGLSEARGDERSYEAYVINHELRVFVYSSQVNAARAGKQIEYNEQLQQFVYSSPESPSESVTKEFFTVTIGRLVDASNDLNIIKYEIEVVDDRTKQKFSYICAYFIAESTMQLTYEFKFPCIDRGDIINMIKTNTKIKEFIS